MPRTILIDEMHLGVLVVMAISNGASLAVLATSVDLGLVAYEMTLLVERVGRVLTPAPRVAAMIGEMRIP